MSISLASPKDHMSNQIIHPQPTHLTLALELKKALVNSSIGRWELMMRGLGRSERLKALMMVSHQGARCQMGSERIHEGSPSFRIKQTISIIQLVPTRRRGSLVGSKKGAGGSCGTRIIARKPVLCLEP